MAQLKPTGPEPHPCHPVVGVDLVAARQPPEAASAEGALREERWRLLERLTRSLEPVMVVLSIAWVALLVVELVNDGLSTTLDRAVWLIWGAFVVDFGIRVLVAPDRLTYLRSQWLTILSLLLPALRILRLAAIFRFLRAGQVVRSVGLLRVVTSLNRGLSTLGRLAHRRGLGYVLAATAIVIAVGSAAMGWFERGGPDSATGYDPVFDDYAGAVWWTASAMTTGPPAEPHSAEGRLLGWLLSLYGLAIFGYLTATLASHFIEQDKASERDVAQPPGA